MYKTKAHTDYILCNCKKHGRYIAKSNVKKTCERCERKIESVKQVEIELVKRQNIVSVFSNKIKSYFNGNNDSKRKRLGF
jgi:hypothetical protein